MVGHRFRIVLLLISTLSVSVFVTACSARAAEAGRPSLCDPTDTAVNDGHGQAFHHFYAREKGPLTSEDCSELDSLLKDAEAFANRYPTVAEATTAGWTQIAAYVEGQGVHFEAPGGSGGPFNPRRPRFLLYDGAGPNSPLAGMMFLQASEAPPPGFPGDNDHWHNHPHLCFDQERTFVIGEHMREHECTTEGGVMVDTSHLWMVHVWLPAYDDQETGDIFDRSHPSL